MDVLCLEPCFGGSHQAMLDGWAARSRHSLTRLTAPAHHWKWRMRTAAVHFARAQPDPPPDVIWCSSMLDLATFRGLAPAGLRAVPAVVYFHENQLAYPAARPDERDVHFGITNLTSALAADRICWNSAWNRDSFLAELSALLRHAPDRAVDADAATEQIRSQSCIIHPGIDAEGIARAAGRARAERGEAREPMHLLWAARWEHDKGPDVLRDALNRLAGQGVDFRLSVIGEQFVHVPEAFEQIKAEHGARLVRFGYQASRQDYLAALMDADVIVSTALHEFFGLAVLEAVAAGCLPVLPRALSYPELLPSSAPFYDGTAQGLAAALARCAQRHAAGAIWPDDLPTPAALTASYDWSRAAPALDAAIDLDI